MANRKVSISMEAKEILENVCSVLEIERPLGVKMALAKGIAAFTDAHSFTQVGEGKWSVPDGIIRGNDYLLFKHLIINEINMTLNEEETNKYFGLFIETGLSVIKYEISQLSSIEDYRITILDTEHKEEAQKN
jgi:hypothetical protein